MDLTYKIFSTPSDLINFINSNLKDFQGVVQFDRIVSITYDEGYVLFFKF